MARKHYYNCNSTKENHISIILQFKTDTFIEFSLKHFLPADAMSDLTCLAVSVLITVAFKSFKHKSFTVITNIYV